MSDSYEDTITEISRPKKQQGWIEEIEALKGEIERLREELSSLMLSKEALMKERSSYLGWERIAEKHSIEIHRLNVEIERLKKDNQAFKGE